MTLARICDECKQAVPMGEAAFWWQLESIEGAVMEGEKDRYHFCSWACVQDFARSRASLLFDAAPDPDAADG